ncbi:glycosyltransferase family 2 protein [Sphingobacterium gobiense]|uniref:Glycosyltransferase family 2 protein n=1 Tax=Sphingobacterium gobiense TaxID=1382456 RepID=A0A2S9JG70_9SPHI|nr:glycosyltransferase family 2 protein [Sphingobacterium gobiense]PRD51918.1 glycosyltransferase family 2 protein [Sphingobacterium gobiense]
MKISIIIVGMNHLQYLKDLFPSIFSLGAIDATFEVIYVDNCSSDGSVSYLEEYFPQVRILKNESPKGFGENNNIGAKAAKGKYLAIINPDIILFKNSLDALLEFAQRNPGVGIMAPKLLNKDETYQYSVRRFITPNLFLSRALAKGDDARKIKGNAYYLCKDMDTEKNQYINWSVGAAYFIAKEHYDMLGGFDEDYFLYMEDEDLCLRSWKMNRPVVYMPKAVMIHNHMRSSRKINKNMKYHFISLFKFWKKHGIGIKDYAAEENIKRYD